MDKNTRNKVIKILFSLVGIIAIMGVTLLLQRYFLG